MSSMKSTLATIFLLTIVFPASRGLAGSGPLPDLGQSNTALGRFWVGELSRLEQFPPDYRISSDGTLNFVASRGEVRLAYHSLPNADAECVLVRITDAVLDHAPSAAPGCLEFVFPWRQGASLAPPRGEAADHLICRGVVDACRLVQIALGQGERPFNSVGLIGDGYGAGIALAVASLMPEKVSFVVAHQPVCLSADLYASSGEATWCEEDAAEARRLEPLLNAERLAPYVVAPTLVIAGEWDPIATPEKCRRLWSALGRRGTLWMLPETGHCLPGELTDWDALWQRWAFVPWAGPA